MPFLDTFAPWECAVAEFDGSLPQLSFGSMRIRKSEKPSCPLPVPKSTLPWALVIAGVQAVENPNPSIVCWLAVR